MGFYVVAFAHEEMCYGGPEEGGWWYTYGEPVTDGDLAKYSAVFNTYDDDERNEKEAYAYCRILNENVTPDWNEAEYEHDYSSVIGGQRDCAEVWENEWPDFFYDVPGCQERPRYDW